MQVVKWNPWGEMTSLQREMDRLFESVYRPQRTNGDDGNAVWRPAVDIHEDANAYEVEVELPGLKKEEITVNYQDGLLSISGERKYENETKEGKNSHRIERFYGRFHRSFNFPTAVNADRIDAKFNDGVLRIVVPKAEEVKPRQIEVA